MFTFPLRFVGQRWIYKGNIVRANVETDSGNVKLSTGEWVSYHDLTPLDGKTKGFRVFDLPKAA